MYHVVTIRHYSDSKRLNFADLLLLFLFFYFRGDVSFFIRHNRLIITFIIKFEVNR